MNWDAVGAIGEIIGALAVFLTLAYLAAQIRQNTKAVRAAALDSSVNAVNAVRVAMFESPDVAAVYGKGLEDPDQLEEDERTRFRLILHTILWTIWNIHSQTDYAGLSKTTWNAQIPVLDRLLGTRGGNWFWNQYKMEFEESFRNEVDKILETNRLNNI